MAVAIFIIQHRLKHIYDKKSFNQKSMRKTIMKLYGHMHTLVHQI